MRGATAAFHSRPKFGEEIRHGTNRGYNAFRCRCKWCMMAHRAYHGAYAAQQRGVQLRTVGPVELSERITVELTLDELVDWDAASVAAGLSRQAYIRRAVNEVLMTERTIARNRERELRSPLLDHT